MTSIAEFNSAADHYKRNGRGFSYATKLKLYGLYKQATIADVEDGGKPEGGLFVSSWKGDRFESWSAQKGLSSGEARSQYVALVKVSDPKFARVGTEEVGSAAYALASSAATEMLAPPPFQVDADVFSAAVAAVSDIKV
jgi:acyl-CoA-binding protein